MSARGDTPASFDAEAEEERPERVSATDAQLGRYQLVYQIASGGMATVFLGRAQGPGGYDRPVALKRIHPHLARRKQFVEMFLDEARIASRISHPNVCAVHDFGEARGTWFIAMEYLVGVPLATLVHAVALRPELVGSARWRALACRIAADAAEGLHAAHELRDDDGAPLHVVHRDVSPQNVFVTFDGAVKVVDFGVARARNRLHQTTTGTLKGKLSYMAPEHAGGGEVDRRSDVWSLGVVLWESLTGTRLFRRKNEMDVLLAVRTQPISPPSAVRPETPPELDAIVMRALDRDPDGRFASAREMARALEAFVRTTLEPTGLSDLAELLGELLRREQTEKRTLVETVLGQRHGVHDVETASLPMPDPGKESSGVRETGSPLPPRPDDAPVHPPYGVLPRRRSRALAVIGGLAMLAAVGGAGLAWWGAPAAPAARGTGNGVAGTEGELPEVRAPRPVLRAGSASEPEAESRPASEPEAESRPASEPEAQSGALSESEAAAPARGAAVEEPSTDVPATDGRRRRAAPSRRVRSGSSGRPADGTSGSASADRATGVGTVAVVALDGWADIYEGSRLLGRTPLSIRLSAGRHVLSARPFGEGPERRHPVVVAPDETVRLRLATR